MAPRTNGAPDILATGCGSRLRMRADAGKPSHQGDSEPNKEADDNGVRLSGHARILGDALCPVDDSNRCEL
jgi:hypothetical protein